MRVLVSALVLLPCSSCLSGRIFRLQDEEYDDFDEDGNPVGGGANTMSAQAERQLSQLNDRIRALEMPAGVLLMLVLGYVAFTFVGFVRVAWPAEARRHMDHTDYDYSTEGWRLSPDGNWAEASLCWFILAGGLVVLAWADWLITLLPAEVRQRPPFLSPASRLFL